MTEVELEHEQEATRIVDEAKTEDGQAKDEADVKEEAEEEVKEEEAKEDEIFFYVNSRDRGPN